jgi:hypothetical protein
MPLGRAQQSAQPNSPPSAERCACNDSDLYLDVVTRYAREIAAIPLRGLYYLYCWQP